MMRSSPTTIIDCPSTDSSFCSISFLFKRVFLIRNSVQKPKSSSECSKFRYATSNFGKSGGVISERPKYNPSKITSTPMAPASTTPASINSGNCSFVFSTLSSAWSMLIFNVSVTDADVLS